MFRPFIGSPSGPLKIQIQERVTTLQDGKQSSLLVKLKPSTFTRIQDP